jgi:hypothetical protein
MPLHFTHEKSNRHIVEGRIPLQTVITSAGHSLIGLGQYEHNVSNVILITNMTRHSETFFFCGKLCAPREGTHGVNVGVF